MKKSWCTTSSAQQQHMLAHPRGHPQSTALPRALHSLQCHSLGFHQYYVDGRHLAYRSYFCRRLKGRPTMNPSWVVEKCRCRFRFACAEILSSSCGSLGSLCLLMRLSSRPFSTQAEIMLHLQTFGFAPLPWLCLNNRPQQRPIRQPLY